MSFSHFTSSSHSGEELENFVKNDNRGRYTDDHKPVVLVKRNSAENLFEERNIENHQMEKNGSDNGDD